MILIEYNVERVYSIPMLYENFQKDCIAKIFSLVVAKLFATASYNNVIKREV